MPESHFPSTSQLLRTQTRTAPMPNTQKEIAQLR
ncbi:MAG: hypothetical protein ACI8ZW_002361, partial [Yoonia sp.]